MIIDILLALASLALGGAAGFRLRQKTFSNSKKEYQKKINTIEEQKITIIEKAQDKANVIIQKAQEQAQQKEENTQELLLHRQEKLDRSEERLARKEEKLDHHREQIEKQKENIRIQQAQLQEKQKEQEKQLESIAKMTKEQAYEKIIQQAQNAAQEQVNRILHQHQEIIKEESETKAQQIIAQALPRVSTDMTSEFTTVSIDIPDEGFKGRIIGREGRNIGFFEKTTGAELIVDDTPLLVRLSCYDHEKRFIAAQTLQRLIKDGKINPHYIEKTYQQVSQKLDTILMEKGKEALNRLNIPMMKPIITQSIGSFYLRYSYGQNLRNHSIEVARIAEAIASEMGVDPLLTKKAGLLHDIGKILAQTNESHAQVGADFLQKHGQHEVIVNAAASHHYDVPMTHVISWIVTAADSISASRPGARFNTKELFIQKMTELEKVITNIHGIEKIHIMQAGREIMVYADPESIEDQQMHKLVETIGQEIQEHLDYPGIIRIVLLRENKIIQYIS